MGVAEYFFKRGYAVTSEKFRNILISFCGYLQFFLWFCDELILCKNMHNLPENQMRKKKWKKEEWKKEKGKKG